MNQILAFTSLIGFIVALTVHIAALMKFNVSDNFPVIWWLHVGIFIVLIPFLVSTRKTLGPKPTFAKIRAAFPKWIIGLGLCIFAYAFVNFALFMMEAVNGSPSIVDGKFVLMNHETLIRELSAAEYSTLRANEVRGFSGHWLVFYFVTCAYFMFNTRSKSLKPTPSA